MVMPVGCPKTTDDRASHASKGLEKTNRPAARSGDWLNDYIWGGEIMRIVRSTLVGTAVAMALFGGNDLAQAQQATQTEQQPASQSSSQDQLQEVVVSGIRYSVEKSLQLKKQAVGTVDVITAESIGKLPDKNVADALQRLPGVNVSSASGTEGAFDEADRVSMRGTSPSLTQTLINGHFVATGDWFVLDQTGTVGRSVSYTLLPSEIVGRVEVN